MSEIIVTSDQFTVMPRLSEFPVSDMKQSVRQGLEYLYSAVTDQRGVDIQNGGGMVGYDGDIVPTHVTKELGSSSLRCSNVGCSVDVKLDTGLDQEANDKTKLTIHCDSMSFNTFDAAKDGAYRCADNHMRIKGGFGNLVTVTAVVVRKLKDDQVQAARRQAEATELLRQLL